MLTTLNACAQPTHVTPQDPKDYAPSTYRKKRMNMRWCHFHLAIVDATPLDKWTFFDVEDWADWLCIYWDARVSNDRYERARRARMSINPEFAAHRRKTKDSPMGRLRKRALRNVRLKHAQPPWANVAAMADKYAEMQRLTRETGEPWHVDHIIPLCGRDKFGRPNVCGLHTDWNMDPTKGSDNSKKWCYFDSDAYVHEVPALTTFASEKVTQ